MRSQLDDADLQAIAKAVVDLLREQGLVFPVSPLLPPQDGWLSSRAAASYLGLSMAALHRHTGHVP